MEKTTAELGLDAAKAFLERTGLTVVDRDISVGRTKVSLVALDGNDLVIVDVRTHKARGGAPSELTKARVITLMKAGEKYAEEHRMVSDITIRVDAISILIVGEDRALLRHHRGLTVGEVESEGELEAEADA